MNDVKSAVRARLLANASYAALTTRVHDNVAPQDAKPPLTIMKQVSIAANNGLNAATGFVNAKIELAHYVAEDDGDTGAAMQKHARTALTANGGRGIVTIAAGQTFDIRACDCVGGEPDEALRNEETGEITLKSTQVYDIWWKE